jgi:hypothetical protein
MTTTRFIYLINIKTLDKTHADALQIASNSHSLGRVKFSAALCWPTVRRLVLAFGSTLA